MAEEAKAAEEALAGEPAEDPRRRDSPSKGAPRGGRRPLAKARSTSSQQQMAEKLAAEYKVTVGGKNGTVERKQGPLRDSGCASQSRRDRRDAGEGRGARGEGREPSDRGCAPRRAPTRSCGGA